MLQRVSHDQKEQAAQRKRELVHLTLAGRVLDLHQTRVVDGLAEINFRGPQPAGLAPAEKSCVLHGQGAHDLCHSKKVGIVICVLLNRDEPGFSVHVLCEVLCKHRFIRGCPLLCPFDGCHQAFNHGAGEFHFQCSNFSRRDPALVFIACPLPENSTTECVQKSLPGTPYHHRTGRPAVSPGQTKVGQTKLVRTQTFSAARIFALRDRGLRSISSSDATSGFLVSKRNYLSFNPSPIPSLTILSSSE